MKFTAFSHPIVNKAYQRITPFMKSKKTASYFTLTLSLFTLSFFGLFAIRPTLITAISLMKTVADLKQLSIDYENKIGSLVRAQSETEQIRDDIRLIDIALPSNSYFSKLARAVEKFAAQENFSVNQLQIDPVPISNPPTLGKLYEYGFILVGTGKYPSISAFLNHLVNWQRIVSIKSMEFTQIGGTESATLRLSLKGTTYYEP
ncbi:type 4a pilus biogenesis protein PilO [Candidatus Gottesmanbacteria bacterium]|nr:type 4a pilus biogenesis protein PilO [Candidatus Gottesmanbacteria bacterium]